MDISSMLEVQVKEETDVKENVTPGKDQDPSATSSAAAPVSQEESNFYKLMFGNEIASVRFRRIHCTACDIHIGSAPAQNQNMFEHPVLRTLLCAGCRDFYGDGTFEQGEDATDMFCRWCANGGNLYCCSYCSNTFCYKCIKRNFTALVRKKIEADEKWKCFVCNPRDLYTARAECWAILQHVQTVRRILVNEKKFSRQEIEEKMNLDETSCCPRRSKRKRRRLDVGSNSEEEEEPLAKVMAKTNGISSNYVKRKPLKKCKYTPPNGIRREIQFRPPIPIRPRPASFLSGDQSFNAEPPKSATSLKNSVVNPKSIIVSTPSLMKSNTSLTSRFDSNALQQQQQQPTLYHTSFMNTSGSTAYIQTPVNSTTRIILPQSQSQLTSYRSQQASSYQPQQTGSYQPQQTGPYQPQQASSYQPQQTSSYQPQQTSSYQPQQTSSYQSQRANSYQSSQPLQSTPNTMVSIPNPMDKHGRALFLLPKSKELDVTLIPNIIELDSDSDDEPRVVAQQNDSTNDENNIDANNSTNKVVPVALTWENSDDDFLREEQPFREIRATVGKEVSFSEMMLPHNQELDNLLSDTKEKVYNLFNLNNAIENIEVEAQQRMKRFYFNMRDTVFQLVHINDRIVRQYIKWKSSRKTETETSSSTNENALVSQKNVDIPLDMICVNDSDAETECENQIRKPSDLIKDNNILKDLLFCKTNVVDRGVGDDSAHLSTDKAIQVYDTVSRDYEKCIGYSMVTKTDQDPKMDDSVSNLPATSDKNFGKYEEQFIFYLQHIEDNGIETESMKGVDLDETSLQEIHTGPLLTPHLLQDIDSSTDQTKNCQEKNLRDNINSVTKDNKNDTVDKNNKEIINNSDTNIEKTNMQLDDKLQQTELQKTQADKMDEKKTMSDNNEANSNKNDNIINKVACTGNEEDCTIIDD